MSLTAALLSTAPDLEIIHADDDYIVAYGPEHHLILCPCPYQRAKLLNRPPLPPGCPSDPHWHAIWHNRDTGITRTSLANTAEGTVSALIDSLEQLNADHPARNDHPSGTPRGAPRQPGSD